MTLTRQQMFALVGYRTPTEQRLRLGAQRSGRLEALDHLAYSQTSRVLEFAEQTAVMSRVMYAAPNLRTRHRLLALDVPTPRWMRAPGEAPGSFALESAMDELAWPAARPDRATDRSTSPRWSPEAAPRSAPATCSDACVRAPSGSAGPAAIPPADAPRRALVGTGAPLRPIRPPRRHVRDEARPDGAFKSGSRQPTSGPGAHRAHRDGLRCARRRGQSGFEWSHRRQRVSGRPPGRGRLGGDGVVGPAVVTARAGEGAPAQHRRASPVQGTAVPSPVGHNGAGRAQAELPPPCSAQFAEVRGW